MRFERNPNYWGTQGFADEVVIQIFSSSDTMVQALKSGDLDYAHGVNADQLKALQTEPDIKTVVGSANGWTQLAFNTYGTGTGKTIKGGGPSTKALLDPAFRDALGYAVDKQTLVDRVLGGFGDAGTTIVPPVLGQWHVDPDHPAHFDIELAKQKLDAAGYQLDASGKRLDKEGKPITLRLYMPDSDENYPKAAQFIKDWYGQLGVKVQTQVLDSATLTDLLLPPEAGGSGNRPSTTSSCGAGPATRTPTRCSRSSSATRSATCPTATTATPTSTRCTTRSRSCRATPARRSSPRCRTSSTTRRSTTSCTTTPTSTRIGPTASPAGRTCPANGTPLFTYGTPGLHAPDRRQGGRQRAAEHRAGGVLERGRAGGPVAPAAPAPSPTSSSGDNTTLIVVVAPRGRRHRRRLVRAESPASEPPRRTSERTPPTARTIDGGPPPAALQAG